jgi:hypothetical protein
MHPYKNMKTWCVNNITKGNTSIRNTNIQFHVDDVVVKSYTVSDRELAENNPSIPVFIVG